MELACLGTRFPKNATFSRPAYRDETNMIDTNIAETKMAYINRAETNKAETFRDATNRTKTNSTISQHFWLAFFLWNKSI